MDDASTTGRLREDIRRMEELEAALFQAAAQKILLSLLLYLQDGLRPDFEQAVKRNHFQKIDFMTLQKLKVAILHARFTPSTYLYERRIENDWEQQLYSFFYDGLSARQTLATREAVTWAVHTFQEPIKGTASAFISHYNEIAASLTDQSEISETDLNPHNIVLSLPPEDPAALIVGAISKARFSLALELSPAAAFLKLGSAALDTIDKTVREGLAALPGLPVPATLSILSRRMTELAARLADARAIYKKGEISFG